MPPDLTSALDGDIEPPDADEPSDDAIAEVSRRAATYHRTRDPRALWPDVDPAAIQRAADEIGRVLPSLLGGDSTTLATTRHDAEALGIAGLVSGAGPLLGHWCETGLLQGEDAVVSVLATHLRHNRLRALEVRSRIGALAADLGQRGIILGVLKGYHTARVYFPEPGARPFADVDLVVRPDELQRTREVLRAHHFVEGAGTDRPYKRDWHAGGSDDRPRSYHFWHARNPWNIELSDAVNFGHVGGTSARRLMELTLDEEWTTSEGTYRVPSRAALLAMVAVHASGELYRSRLLRLVELVLIARRDAERAEVDWDTVLACLTRTHTLRYAWPALHLAERLVPHTIPPQVIRAAQAASTEMARRIVATLTPTAPVFRPSGNVGHTLMFATSWREIAGRLWEILRSDSGLPVRAVLSNYHWRARRRLRASRLRRSVRGSDRTTRPE
jgi:hypothetical protein